MVNYREPLLPAHQRKTYSISAPIQTHTRRATCDEVDCVKLANGWDTILDESTTDGQFNAATIRALRGYQYTSEINAAGLTVYHFGPGQQCFEGASGRHRVPLDRPEFFVVRGGDHRGNPRGDFVERSADNWLDDLYTHTGKIQDAINQG